MIRKYYRLLYKQFIFTEHAACKQPYEHVWAIPHLRTLQLHGVRTCTRIDRDEQNATQNGNAKSNKTPQHI